jgi:hypothetical protein
MHEYPTSTNGQTNGFTSGASDYDAGLDQLYSWYPPQVAPQACPEAAFSLCIKGRLDGLDTQLTVRGQTPPEFLRNLAAVRGLLDAPVQAGIPVDQGAGWCKKHQLGMQLNHGKDGKSDWYSHRQEDGTWCRGK